MTAFFLSAAGVSAVYFVVLLVYAKQLLSGSWIWLFFAGVCLVNALLRYLHAKSPARVSLFFLTFAHTISLLGMIVLMAAGIVIASGMHPKEKGSPEYAIVLGAGLKPDGTLSKTLRQRLDAALRFAEESPDTGFVLSGGHDRRGQRSEAEAMAAYLEQHGIPRYRLLLEMQSKNTYENIVYSHALLYRLRNESNPCFFDLRGESFLLVSPEPVSLGIVSSEFHLYRASAILKKQFGIQALGISAPSDPVLFVHYLARESIALLKDKFLGRL